MFSLTARILCLILFIYSVLNVGKCSELLIKRSIDYQNFDESLRDDIQDSQITFDDNKRDESSCSFFNFQDVNEEPHYSRECPNDSIIHQGNETYKFLGNFVEQFTDLMKQISIKESYIKGQTEAVYFVGNTGSGKSTTVQIVTGNNSELYSIETGPGTDNYIIADGTEKIGRKTITSQTLFPEFFVDNETNFVIYDCPGFRDTRSKIHELVTVYSLRKTLHSTRKFKIAIVVTHAALIPGNFRSDVLDAIKHVSEMFRDVDKYRNSFYLIATKAENKAKIVKGQVILESDEKIVTGIGHFLREIKNTLVNGEILTYSVTEREKLIKIVDALLEQKDNVTYNRISVIRRPMEEGPLLNNNIIQNERNKIRKMLLNDDNMVTATGNDFGFPLSGDAVLYLKKLIEKMNSYMSYLSKEIGKNIVNHFVKLFDSNSEIDFTINQIQDFQENFTLLSKITSQSENPRKFIQVTTNFSEINSLKVHCLYNSSDIYVLDDALSLLRNYTESAKYSPSNWKLSDNEISGQISNKLVQYRFLLHMFELLTSHNVHIERNKITYSLQNNEKELKFHEENIINNLLEKFNLKSRYRSMIMDNVLFNKLNDILNVTLKSELNVTCNGNSVIITDYTILLSNINNNDTYKLCGNVDEIVILALHTIFFDEDLTDDWFKGKIFTIIAPIWEVIGVRKIDIDGMNGCSEQPKAYQGEIGKHGQHGKPGGSFIGVGMIFNNGKNLVITANGGNGQNGQDGGDGKDGIQGSEGPMKRVQIQPWVFLFYNRVIEVYESRGSFGTPGGDSGAGGKGGIGGTKGSVTIYNVGRKNNEIKTEIHSGVQGTDGTDGVPGVGGKGVCGRRMYEKESDLLVFLPLNSWTETEYINCDTGPIINGRVQKSYQPRSSINISKNDLHTNTSYSKCKVCDKITLFQQLHRKPCYQRIISDGVTNEFINSMKSNNELICLTKIINVIKR